MKKDYSRSVSLLCPTCAGADFKFDENALRDERQYTCITCGSVFNYLDLTEQNQSQISSGIEEMKHEIVSNFRADLRKSLSKFKGWKIK